MYRTWLERDDLPDNLREELQSIANRPEEIRDRFYSELTFGTGGMRGILGAGTNRMNIYTIRRATRGLAQYIQSQGGAEQGVVVGYDCRHMSREFALEVGRVLAAAGVKAYVFQHLCPTPELSYAVRHLQAAGGVMITASHNPPEYNGYTVYDNSGCQVLDEAAKAILREIDSIDDWFGVPAMDQREAEASGLLCWIGREVDEDYYRTVVRRIDLPSVSTADRSALKVVYSPLHGTGNVPVRTVLKAAGFTDVTVVPSQELPDGDFPTAKSPNPEERTAFAEALKLAQSIEADIALATDPDADRVGVAVRTADGEYTLLTGNQVGGLLVNFLLDQKQRSGELPANGIVFKTIVTSELGAEAARQYGVSVENTLTGFKYIGDRIRHYESTGEKQFLFGYEESYGYLVADFVRDKDAVQTCLLICLMAAHYRRQNMTLLDALEQLYKRVGYFREELMSATLPGADGMEKMAEIMAKVRREGVHVPGMKLEAREDYRTSERIVLDPSTGQTVRVEKLTLPVSDVVKYVFAGGSWFALRPSGTEPKIKVYFGARGETEEECERILDQFRQVAKEILHK
jgi:phosphoglucomutase